MPPPGHSDPWDDGGAGCHGRGRSRWNLIIPPTIGPSQAEQVRVTGPDRSSLENVWWAARLYRMEAEQAEVGEQLTRLFGWATCPSCVANFSGPEQIVVVARTHETA